MSTERDSNDYTVRELFTESERLARELVDHLENGFVPKLHALRDLVSPRRNAPDELPIEDSVVRTQTSNILTSDHFGDHLATRLIELCHAIDVGVEKIVSGKG